MIALWLAVALGAEHRVVRPGQTVESIAEEVGDPGLADGIRAANQIPAGQQPAVGSVVFLPDGLDGHVDQPALVLAVRGSVEVQRPGQRIEEARLGDELPAGTGVCTGPQSTITLRLAAAGVGDTHDDLTLFPATCITVDAASARGELRHSLLSLREGSVSVRATDSQAGAVTVRTRAGVTSGAGGGFRVHVEADSAARTEALDAIARVFGAEREMTVPAGYGSRVREGQAPSAPVKLLVPGEPTAPGDGASLHRPDFAWTPVNRALGYQVQIGGSADFSDLLLMEPVDQALWEPERLFLPTRVPGLWWRVASVDRTGFIGRWSEPRLLAVPAGLGAVGSEPER